MAQKFKFECDLGVLFQVPTNQIFAKSSPKKMAKSKAKAKAKGKAKAKANPKEKSAPTKVKKELPKTPEKTPPCEVSRSDQQMFNTFPARSDDPRAESLNAIYHGMAGNDPKKNGLVSQWKLDKTLSWHVHHEEVHSSGKQAEQGQTIGWIPRWFFTFGFIDVLGNCMLFWGRASRVEYMSTTIWVAFVPIDCLTLSTKQHPVCQRNLQVAGRRCHEDECGIQHLQGDACYFGFFQ